MPYRSDVLLALTIVVVLIVAAFVFLQERASSESEVHDFPEHHTENADQVDKKQQGVDKPPDHADRSPTESNLIDGYIISRMEDWVPILRVRRNCYDRPNPSAGNLEFSCEVVTEYDHPYGLFSYDQLISISDVDAEASFILGHRLFNDPSVENKFDYQEAVGYLLNAAVLSGQSQPYLAMLRARGLTDVSKVNGQLNPVRAKEAYIWTKAGVDSGLLPPSDGSLDWLVSVIASNRYENDGIDLADWDQEAKRLAEYIRTQRAHRATARDTAMQNSG